MSNFNCDICGLPIIENESGEYITGCNHYPIEKLKQFNKNYTETTAFKLPSIVIKKKELEGL